jgi:ribosome-associated toxin RatA of RatAB toxin-antitoxin module
MAIEAQTYSTTAAATVTDCFAVVTDFDTYPTWASAVRRAAVRMRHPDGLPRQVEMEIDIKVRRIRYVLEYNYTSPHRLDWKLVEGDLRNVEGSYVFEDAGDGWTRVTCTQAVDVGFWIPGFLRSIFEQQALRDSVEEFKRAVEAHHQAT